MPKTVFNPFTNAIEQTLYDNIINEVIDIHSPEIYYIPRNVNVKDEIFFEADIATYKEYFVTNMMFKTVENFGGDGRFLGRFGIEVRDQITLVAGKTRFETDSSNTIIEITQPREGDLLYIPMIDKLYTIMYSNEATIFYQLGKLPVYELTLELFEYSNEEFDTGIPSVDYYNTYRLSADSTANAAIRLSEANTYLAQNDEFESEADLLIDFTKDNPFGTY